MRLKILKHLLKNNLHSKKEIRLTADVISSICDIEDLDEKLKDELMGVMSDLYGYLEVKKLIEEEGMSEESALNSFVKRVIKIYN